MSKKRRLEIWVILCAALVLILLIWLFVQSYIGPNSVTSEAQLVEKLKAAKKIGYIRIYAVYSNNVAEVHANFQNSDSTWSGIAATVLNANDFKAQISDLGNKIVIEKSLPQTIFDFLQSLLPFLFPLLLITWFVMSFTKKGGGILGAGLSGGFKGTKLQKSNIMFKDVAGIVDEKKELMEIVDFLKFPKKYIAMGARIPKGLLLYGPPGTGKTLLAKAVSGESKVPFYSVAGSEFDEAFVGLGASRIRELFKNAKKNAPCIVFIDEIDSLGSSRTRSTNSLQDQTLNQFLSELDGFEENVGVVIVGATNRFETLDRALLRSGRFDRKIQITLPDLNERKEILQIHSRNKKIAKNVDFEAVASRTPGFSGAELENSLNEAALLAVRRNKNIIEKKDIEEGIDRVVGGPAKTSRIVSPKVKILVAIHEAGHALAGLLLSDAMKIQKVTIIPRGNAGGYTVTSPKDQDYLLSKQALNERMVGLLAGRAAEHEVFGAQQITTGAEDDFLKATNLAKQMVERFGMSATGLRYFDPNALQLGTESRLSEQTKKQIDDSINNILNLSFESAKKVIKKEKKLLFLIAESLLILETITGDEVNYINKEQKIPVNAADIKAKNPDKVYLDLKLFEKLKVKTEK